MLCHVCVCFAVDCAITTRRIVLGWLCNPSIPPSRDQDGCELHYYVLPLLEVPFGSMGLGCFEVLGSLHLVTMAKLETHSPLLDSAVFGDARGVGNRKGILPPYELETCYVIKCRLLAAVSSAPFNVLSSRPSTFPSAFDLASSPGRVCLFATSAHRAHFRSMTSPRYQHVKFRVVFKALRNGPTTDATTALFGSMQEYSSAEESPDAACRTFPSPTAHSFPMTTSKLAPVVAHPHVCNRSTIERRNSLLGPFGSLHWMFGSKTKRTCPSVGRSTFGRKRTSQNDAHALEASRGESGASWRNGRKEKQDLEASTVVETCPGEV